MSTTVTVTATLPYALRNPDCTALDDKQLMKMAARELDRLYNIEDALKEIMEHHGPGSLATDKIYEGAIKALHGPIRNATE